jgi:rhamnosyltransferase
VVIPTWNGGTRFRECLDAVAKQELSRGFELVIIDSSSTDGTAELGREHADVFISIRKEEFNHGITRNRAIAKSRGAFIALLVQDATPADAHWLEALVDNFADEKVAGCYSRQVPRPECPPLLKARLERWSASRAERVEKAVAGEEELLQVPGKEQVDLIAFDNVSSCIRRSVWERMPFPERPFGEDLWWARSVLLSGYKIVFEPRSAVIHSHANSLFYEFKRVYLDHQNWNDLIGLRLFGRLREVWGASISGVQEARQDLKNQGLSGLPYVYWVAYALPYVLSQNLAQFLGGNSRRFKEQWPWFERLERVLSQGV